jgi:prophage regulatory protein
MTIQIETLKPLSTLKQVKEFTSLSKASIYRYIKLNIFPQPIRIHARRVVWTAEDLIAWKNSLTK